MDALMGIGDWLDQYSVCLLWIYTAYVLWRVGVLEKRVESLETFQTPVKADPAGVGQRKTAHQIRMTAAHVGGELSD